MKTQPTKLSKLVSKLDLFFKVKELEKDPAMSNFVPQVYKSTKLNWKKHFEEDFTNRFNGLMIKGLEHVNTVFTSAFPHEEILHTFLSKSNPGDVLFLHHPIPLESGDPKGTKGKGFLPINPKLLIGVIEKNLSIYSCHAPLDYNQTISTNRAIAEQLNAKIIDEFLPYGNGNAGLIVTIKSLSTSDLVKKLKKVFKIPYVDFAGKKLNKINKIAIVAGGGDEIEYSKIGQEMGAQAYISGEIFSNHNSKWARLNSQKIKKYVKDTNLSLIGVSHAASEYLVMKTQIPKWLKANFNIKVVPIPQSKWWF